MENLKMRHLLAMPVIAVTVAMTINSCTIDPIPVKSYPKSTAALLEERKNQMDIEMEAIWQKHYGKMSDSELLRGDAEVK
ncbi:hypothetical protein [Neisseria sp. S1]|uniref:hypothetical protein n=1 Tax=Neisseria sp. S1 TaxID=3318354 RepID=UPI003A8B87BA